MDEPIIGYWYIAKRPCGRASALAWDDDKYKKDTAKSVAEWIRRGDTVERVARRKSDPTPELICQGCRGKACQSSPAGTLFD